MNKSTSNNFKIMLTLSIVLFAVLIVIGIKSWQQSNQGQMNPEISRSIGPKNAKISIIEFIDLQCPACARGVALLKEYTDKYPNDIHVQVKFFPLVRAHQHAIRSAVYTECAARQGKFWDYLHKILGSQMQWSSLINADGVFGQIAKDVGLNQQELDRCLNDERVKDVIEADRQLGVSMEVQSTPTYFVNNKMVVGPKGLDEALKSLLETQP